MQNFILYSIIGSVVLTVLVNVLPMLFPKSAEKAERKIQEKLTESLTKSINEREQGRSPRVRVFFPWKAMLIASIGLTVLVNLIGWFAR